MIYDVPGEYVGDYDPLAVNIRARGAGFHEHGEYLYACFRNGQVFLLGIIHRVWEMLKGVSHDACPDDVIRMNTKRAVPV